VIFVADEGVDAPIVQALRNDGHEVRYVAEAAPGLSDDQVLDSAVRHGAVLLTADKGFGELVFLQHRKVPGVLLVRLAGLSLATKAELVARAVRQHGGQLAGAFSVLAPKSIRIRKRI